MSYKLREKYQGFTIIEVMIVLAIAAVILLAIFLAVPNLQRNSRNTQRKNDVASVLAAVNEYSSNQNGTLPTCLISNGTNQVAVSGAAANSTFAQCSAGTGHVVITVSGQFTSANIAALPGSIPTTATANVLQVYTAAACNGNSLGQGSGRSVVAWYQVEPVTDQCTGS